MEVISSRFAELRGRNTPAFTDQDLVDAAKAIKDHMEESLTNRMEMVRDDLSMRIGKVLDDRLIKGFGEVDQKHTKVLAEGEHLRKYLAEMDARYTKMLESTRQTYQKSLDEVVDRYEKRLTMMEKSQETYADFLKKSYEGAMSQISDLLKNLQIPAPNVVFSPTIGVPEVKNMITMPEQPAPVVNVSPQLTSPEVVVNVAPTPPRKKTFSYDENGRPLEVREEDVL